MRTVIAFLSAPIIPIIVLIIYWFLPSILASSLPSMKSIVITFVVGLLLSYILILVIGVPLFLILGKLRRLNLAITIISGAMIASMLEIISVVYRIITFDPDSTSKFSFSQAECQEIIENERTSCGYVVVLQNIAELALGGALAGMIFWFIYRRGEGAIQSRHQTDL